ncbi:DUF3291 domain-containing protein [Streptomyces sp. NPDC004647]|uniref:DUF3291 domain-containing protein n=1 Tax=Streptomyces sp. NPDC004647 TaxID=3154671 RepID=UPI0033AE5860
MPTLPWTTPNPAPPHTRAYVMASRFEVRSGADVPRFFLKSLSAWGQVRKAPGAFGASLIAQPLKRVFFTLSAWEDRDALYGYARTEPHRSVMNSMRKTMRISTFTFWEVPVEELPITWDDAKRRLAEQAALDAAGDGRPAH